jgi:integrase
MAGRPKGWKLGQDRRTGNFYARFSHNGRRRNLLLAGARDRGAAQSEAARIYAEVVSGRYDQAHAVASSGGAPFLDVASEWLAEIESSIDPETYKLYETTYVGNHFMRAFKSIGDLSSTGAAAYVSARLKKVTRETLKKELSALRQIAAYAVAHNHLAAQPEIKTPGKKTLGTRVEGKRRASTIFTGVEIQRVIAKLPDWIKARRGGKPAFSVRHRFVVAWETALRPETLAELRAPDDYRRGAEEMVIRDEADKNRFGRTLPLSPKAREALDRICPEVGLIFGAHDFRIALRKAAKAAGIEAPRCDRITDYDFRHSRLTEMGQSSDNLVGLMYLAGHRQPATTARYMRPAKNAGSEVLAASAAAEPKASNHELWPHSGRQSGRRSGQGGSREARTPSGPAGQVPDSNDDSDRARRGNRTPMGLHPLAPQGIGRDQTIGIPSTSVRPGASESASKRPILVAATTMPGASNGEQNGADRLLAADDVDDTTDVADPISTALGRARQAWVDDRDRRALRRTLLGLVQILDEDPEGPS